jgi:hypothetical protein
MDNLRNVYYSFGVFVFDKKYNFSRELSISAVVPYKGVLYVDSVGLTTTSSDTSGIQPAGHQDLAGGDQPASFIPPIDLDSSPAVGRGVI